MIKSPERRRFTWADRERPITIAFALKAKARIAVDLGPLSVRFQLLKPCKFVLKADPARRVGAV